MRSAATDPLSLPEVVSCPWPELPSNIKILAMQRGYTLALWDLQLLQHGAAVREGSSRSRGNSRPASVKPVPPASAKAVPGASPRDSPYGVVEPKLVATSRGSSTWGGLTKKNSSKHEVAGLPRIK